MPSHCVINIAHRWAMVGNWWRCLSYTVALGNAIAPIAGWWMYKQCQTSEGKIVSKWLALFASIQLGLFLLEPSSRAQTCRRASQDFITRYSRVGSQEEIEQTGLYWSKQLVLGSHAE